MSEKAPQKSIRTNYVFNLSARLITMLVPLIVAPFISRRLGPDGVGLCSFIASIVSYFTLVANLGVESYALREISMHRDDDAFIKKFVAEISIMKGIFTVACMGLFYLVFMNELGGDNGTLYIVYSLSIIQVAFDFTWYFQGVEKFGLIAATTVISRLVYLPLVLIFVTTKDDIWLYALLTILMGIAAPVACIPFMAKNLPGKIEGKIRPFSHFKSCMVYFLPAIATQIYTVVDKTMIGLITHSAFENGYYEQADKIVRVPLTVLYSVNAIMESRIAYYYSQDDMDSIHELTEKSANFAFMLAFPMMFGFIAVAKTFIPLYLGQAFAKCVPLMYILSPILVIIAISNLLSSHYYTPFGKRKQSALFLVAGAVVNIILNSFMIKLWQAKGAAIASLISEFVITVLFVVFSRKFVFKFSELLKSAWKYLVAALVMGVGVFFMNMYLPEHNGWILLAEILTGVAVYCVMLIVLRCKFFTSNVKDVVSKFIGMFRKKPAAEVGTAPDGNAPEPTAVAPDAEPCDELSSRPAEEPVADESPTEEAPATEPERPDAASVPDSGGDGESTEPSAPDGGEG